MTPKKRPEQQQSSPRSSRSIHLHVALAIPLHGNCRGDLGCVHLSIVSLLLARSRKPGVRGVRLVVIRRRLRDELLRHLGQDGVEDALYAIGVLGVAVPDGD